MLASDRDRSQCPRRPVRGDPLTDRLIILAVAALVVLLVVLFEAEETWRWRGSENRPESRFGIVRSVRRAVGGFLAIVTLRRWRRGRRSKSAPAPMASDDVARRLGFGEAAGPVLMAPQRIVVSGPRRVVMDPPPPAVIPPEPIERNSRVRLLRDTAGAALVLAGFVIVAVNVVIPPQSAPQPSGQVEAATAFAPVVVTPAPTASPTSIPVGLASIAPEPSLPLLLPGLVSAEPTPTATPAPPPPAAPRKTQAPAPTSAPTQAPTATPEADSETDAQAHAETQGRPFSSSVQRDQSRCTGRRGTVTFSITSSNADYVRHQLRRRVVGRANFPWTDCSVVHLSRAHEQLHRGPERRRARRARTPHQASINVQ